VRLWKLGKNAHCPRILVRGQAIAAMGDELRLGRLRSGLEADIRPHRLATVAIRDANDGGLPDRIVLIEHILHLAGPDLEPRRDDQILPAVDEVKPSMPVGEPNVAGE